MSEEGEKDGKFQFKRERSSTDINSEDHNGFSGVETFIKA